MSEREPYKAPAVDLETADLELNSSIYEGFSTAIMVKDQPRTIALCREYSDAVQLMALIERARLAKADTILSPRGEQTEAVARAVSEIIADLKLRGYANLSGDPDWCKEGRAWERIIARHPAGADWKRVEQIVQLHVLRACNRVLTPSTAGDE